MVIDLATDFSPYPAGRFYSDGQFSGQRFREEFLIPALRNAPSVTIKLGGTKTCGSSFLEEAFGGVVRLGYFHREELRARLKIEGGSAAHDMYKSRAESYIDSATFGADADKRTEKAIA